jgi:hypothetical protein
MNENDRAKVARARALREKLINCNPNDIDQRLVLLLALLEVYEELMGEK